MERILRERLNLIYPDCLIWNYDVGAVYAYVRFTTGDRLHMLVYHIPSSTAEIFELKEGGIDID